MVEELRATPFDDGIDLKKAYERVLESLAASVQCRKKQADPAIGWNYENLWYEENMVHYAVSTANNDQNSNYYDPQLYAALKRKTDRTSKGLFSTDDYFDMEAPVELNLEESKNAKAAKAVVKDEFRRARFKPFAKRLIERAAFVDCAVGKIVPCNTGKMMTYRKLKDPADISKGYEEVTEEVKKENIAYKEVELLNMYFEDLFVDTLDDTNVTELIDSTVTYLKDMERKGYYGNVDQVKPSAVAAQYVVDNFKTEERQNKDNNSNKTVKNVLLAEYWGELIVDGESKFVQIVLAGDQVIRAKFVKFWHGTKPYILHSYERVPGLITGMSPARRLLISQFALNQLYNLEIENGMLKGSGAMISDQRTLEYLKKQVPKGKWRRGQIVGAKLGSKSIRDVIMEVPFADVTKTCENVMDRIKNSIVLTTSSPESFSGQPTGSQLDRTASGYAAAVGEANISIEQMIYTSQDELIEPAVEMTYQYLQEYLTDDIHVKEAGGKWVKYSPDEIYGLFNVTVYGGSKYLERREKAASLQESIEMLKGAPNSIQDIQFGILYSRYLKYKDIEDPDEIIRNKSAEQVFGELLQKAPPEVILQWAEMAKNKSDELKMKKMVDQENYEKSRTIHTIETDEAYNKALGKVNKQL